MSHKCNSCDDVFTYKEARYEPIYEFELSEEYQEIGRKRNASSRFDTQYTQRCRF